MLDEQKEEKRIVMVPNLLVNASPIGYSDTI